MVHKNQGVCVSRICKWPEDNLVPLCRGNNWHKRTEDEMGKYLQKRGFALDYMVWKFHGESAQCARAEVLRRHTDKHGTRMQYMVQDFDDARDSDNEMEESAKAFN